MNTEITDNKVGWVLYDGDCSLCTAWARRFERVLRRAGFTLATLQNDANWLPATERPLRGESGERLTNLLPLPFGKGRGEGLLRVGDDAKEPTEMLVRTPDGRTFGGADGLVQIARRVKWAWPLFALAQAPGAMPLLRAGYRLLAANRHCFGGACRGPRRKPLEDWSPLLLLPLATFCFRDALPDWVFMWVIAYALYAGCKWLTFRESVKRGAQVKPLRAVGYLLAWPGMDALTFLNAKTLTVLPHKTEWLLAVGKTLFGAVLVWFVARLAAPINPLLTGWVGMFGIIFVLHFGLFHLLSLAWRQAGVNAAPLMRGPLLSRSLAEFWGKRWNTAFHEIVHRFTFRPLLRRTGARGATLLVFLVSGLVHELVISFPAGGGYGLPITYFLVQGLGVIAEHTRLGRRMGLGRGLRGWLFTVVVSAGPSFWLFHPPFIKNVILPMLHAFGAI